MITDLDLGSFFLTIVDEKDGVLYKDGNLKYYIIPNEIRKMGTKHNNINCIFNIMTDKYLFFTSNQPKISQFWLFLSSRNVATAARTSHLAETFVDLQKSKLVEIWFLFLP